MIRGQTRTLETPEIKTKLNASIHNRFDIEVIDSKTGEIKEKAQAENIILNQMWNHFTSAWAYYIHYGSGTTTPTASDSSLTSFVSAVSSTLVENTTSGGTITSKCKITLGTEDAVGVTIGEVGVGWGSSSSNLSTKALLQDMNGNAITITKTDTDIINIYSTVFGHFDTAGYDNGNIIFTDFTVSNPVGYSGLIVGNGRSGYSSYIYAAVPNQTANGYMYRSGSRISVTTTYDAANKKETYSTARFNTVDGNTSGIHCIMVGFYANNAFTPFFICYVGDNAWYTGTNIAGEAIGTGDGTTKDFATNFPLITDAIIYVDGVAQTVTIDEGMPVDNTNLGMYFRFIPEKSDIAGVVSGTPHYHCSASNSIGDVTAVYYNPFWAKGLDNFYAGSNAVVEMSDDLETWVTVSSPISSAYKNYKYIRISGGYAQYFTSSNIAATNIHFASAPAQGAVITGSYKTKTIAKDENHVFDFSCEISFNEYTT